MRAAVTVVLVCTTVAFGQDSTYKPGVTFQSTNPNYPVRNPFYFEGRVDWDLLKIDQPANAWEYAQRGIHKQDDLEDFAGAIDDYGKAVALNSIDNGTCQIITAVTPGFGQNTNPPPCMFTVRLRLGNLLKVTNPEEAIRLFHEVLTIDPLRLGVNALIGETYAAMAMRSEDEAIERQLREKAVIAYKAELELSPVTELSKQLTGDEANNAHVHWALAELYEKMEMPEAAAMELDLYLRATKWHSDTYPWRIELARKRLEKLQRKAESGKPLSHAEKN